jgi:prevent-host-death family protein
MSKEVTVAELREKLEEIIAEVEAGESVTIVKEPGQLSVSQNGKRFPFRDIVISPLKKPITIDAVDLIREDRDDEIRKHGF